MSPLRRCAGARIHVHQGNPIEATIDVDLSPRGGSPLLETASGTVVAWSACRV